MSDVDLRSSAMTDAARSASQAVERETDAYSKGEDRPLLGYVGLLSTYGGVVSAMALAARLAGRRVPARPSAADLALGAVATYKVSRIIAKDPVTSPLRAPFTTFEGQAGPAEIHEEVRGHGWRHAVGELLTCPFCLGQWIATAFWFGLVVRPRETRLVGAVFATVAASDALQLVYAKAEQQVD